jgi:hypothetical protein
MYEPEDQLQTLLEDNPELLLGETAETERPSKYLLIARAAGVPEAAGASDRWFLDHLFLDAEGLPTLVEVKRSTDSRIRREVVGADARLRSEHSGPLASGAEIGVSLELVSE